MSHANTRSLFKYFSVLILLSSSFLGWGQVTLTGTSYTENFDGIGSGLPTGWTARTGATSTSLGTTSTFVSTATSWANTAGQFQNSAAAESPSTSADNATAQSGRTDRVIAIRQSGTVGDPGAAFVLQILNTTGFSNFNLNFKLMQLDPTVTAGRSVTWNVDYGFGASPSTFTNVSTTPATLTTTLGSAWGSTSVSVNFGSSLDNNLGPVWIRITTKSASSGSGSRPVTAIDDFSLTWSLAATPDIAISNAHPASTNISQASTNNILASYQLDVTTAAATLNSMSVTTAGTYAAGDIATNGFKFWINSSNNLTGATQLGTAQAAVGNGGTVAVSGLAQSVPIGTRYILLTADIASGATPGNTIRIAPTAFTNITFASGNKTGSNPAAASNDMTVIACTPTNATGLTLTPGNTQLAVSWTNPSCLDEVMIVAKASGSISGTPTGDGSSFTANLTLGSGTAFDGGFVVYKGTASPQNITGLTNGTTYFVKVFTRRGTTWSSGVESSGVPVLASATKILWSSSGGSAWLTGSNWTGSSVASGDQTAEFAANPTSAAGVGINFSNTTNAGTQVNGQRIQEVGAVEIANTRSATMIIGNSSGTAGATGQFRLNGVVVNSIENTVIRNNSDQTLTIQNTQSSGNQTMAVILNNSVNNNIVIDGSGNIIISSVITSAAGPVTIDGSGSGIVEFTGQNTYTTNTVVKNTTLRLNRTGGNTLPATNNITVEGGTLRISTNQTINNLTLSGGSVLIDAGVTLTINGTVTRTGGSIDASASGATIVFGNASPVTLPAGLFSGAIQNLTISGTGGVTAGSDLTINGVLNLAAPNPNNNRGLLEMTSSYANYADTRVQNNNDAANNLNSFVLTMGPSATTTGQGDVTGKIRRTSFTSGTMYTFGNANTQLTFTGASLPTQITVVSTRGTEGLHTDKGNSLQRLYQVLRTGGADPTTMTIRLAYDDSELNGNDENRLVLWDHHIPYGGVTPHEHGKTNQSTAQNWVELTSHLISYLATEGNASFTKYWMISNKETEGNSIWLGATENAGPSGTNWSNPSNWAAGVLPTADSNIVLVANAPRTAVLSGSVSMRTLSIGANTTLNAGSSTITITGGPASNGGSGSWLNQGTFTSGTSTVIFDTLNATIAGNTAFYNLHINNDKSATLQANSEITINNNLTLGTNATFNANTNSKVIYAGASPTVAAANYHSLEINAASGTATMPGSLSVKGDLITHTAADFLTNTTSLVMNGNTQQNISGAHLSALYNVEVNNSQGVVLNRNTTLENNLTLTSGDVTLTGQTVTARGAISRTSGRINGSNGTLHMNGSAPQSIPGSLFVDTLLQNLTIENTAGVTLSGWVKVTGVVTPTSGQLNTGNRLILASTASATARIAAGTGSYITGDVQVRRHIGALPMRRWRFLSSPVQGKTLNDWRFHIYITGPAGAGFDPQNTSTTVFSYNESTAGDLNQGWTAATNITNPITTGAGFRVFVRGSRNQNINTQTQDEVVLSLTGAVNTGDIPMPVSFTANAGASNDGWCLVGNPYPSDFDWKAFYDAKNADDAFIKNIDPTIYIYNPIVGTTYGSFNALNARGTGQNGLLDGIIPQGAAFWVKANGTNPVLVLQEAYKTNTQALPLHKTEQGSGFRIRMVQDQYNSDEMSVFYHPSASANYDVFDIKKMPGGINIMAYGADSVNLALSVRPLLMQNDTIRLNVTGSSAPYTMQFINSKYIALKDQVFLVDEFTQKYVNLKTTTAYTFDITSDPNSFGPNRFYIIVASDNALPVDLIHFNAKLNANKQVDINWATAAEVNASTFEVQRSSDNHSFETIKTVQAPGKSSEMISYTTTDERPEALNYYRLKMIDNDGSYRYSAVRLVSLVDLTANSTISLYPVPANKQLTIANKNGIALRSITLYNAMGKIVATYSTEKTEMELDIHTLQPGVYIAEITDAMGTVTKQKFVKE